MIMKSKPMGKQTKKLGFVTKQEIGTGFMLGSKH